MPGPTVGRRPGRGRHRDALTAFAAARQVQEQMASEHALAPWIAAGTVAARPAAGTVAARARSASLRRAAAALRLAEHDSAAARRELRLGGPPGGRLTRIEALLLDARACRELGDPRVATTAVEQALDLAEPDRLILPFVTTGAEDLLTALPRPAHAALIADILDTIHGVAPAPATELSPGELRVLRYLPTNLTRPEIARELSVSVNTVNTHLKRIYAKLAATDRSAAVQRGRELRLLSAGR